MFKISTQLFDGMLAGWQGWVQCMCDIDLDVGSLVGFVGGNLAHMRGGGNRRSLEAADTKS